MITPSRSGFRLAKLAGIAATVMGVVASGVYITGAEDPARRSGDRAGSSRHDATVDEAAVAEELARMPLSFEPNVGQGGDGAAFVARGLDYGLALSPTEATMSAGPSVVKMRLVGANASAAMTGGDELEGRINYFVGDDPAAWRTDVATYAQVRSTGVWAGVDLVWHAGKAGELEYDFIVAPGTSPDAIAVGFEGAKSLRLDGGDLLVATDGGELRQHAPVLYQDSAGRRKPVPGSFVLDGNTVRFSVGAYDTTQPLVIDPTLEWSTYLGGATAPFADDVGHDIAVDSTGAAYVAGQACSASFPKTTYAYDRVRNGQCDAFVTKFAPVQGTGVGTGLKYSTYLGGSSRDEVLHIALDSANNAHLMGSTFSGDFPTTVGAYQTTGGDSFVAKLNPKGSKLLYSTRLEGQDPTGMALGPALPATPGQPTVYVVGEGAGPATTPDAFKSNCQLSEASVCRDLTVSRINPVGGGASDLLYATYLGGDTPEQWAEIAVDNIGRIYLTGILERTGAVPGFPMAGAGGSFDTSPANSEVCTPCFTAFVAKLDPSLPADGSGVPSAGNQQLAWSTYLDNVIPFGIALGPGETVYLTGTAREDDGTVLATTAGAFDTEFHCFGFGSCDGFLAKLDPAIAGDGSGTPSAANQQLVYSTYLDQSSGLDLVVDGAGRAWVAGGTNSSTVDLKDPLQATCGCFTDGTRSDGVVFGFDPAGAGQDDLAFSTYLGGKSSDWFNGITLGSPGSVYVTGLSASYKNSHGNGKADRYPVRPNNFQMNNPGGAYNETGCTRLGVGCADVVVSKITGL